MNIRNIIRRIHNKLLGKYRTRKHLKKINKDNPYIKNHLINKSIYWVDTHQPLNFNNPYSTTSMICNQSFFDMPFFRYWADRVLESFCYLMKSSGQLTEKGLNSGIVYHRKLWEFVYIAQALYERNMLREGLKGIGFGIGEEPLVSLFADYGCEIVATDMDEDKAKELGWSETGQHASNNILKLNAFNICAKDKFMKNVTYKTVDMNNIPEELINFDFCWSSCAFEHLGTIENGLNFVKNSLKTLKSGGICVHTTEFNVFSNDETLDNNPLYVLFRKKDIIKLINDLTSEGHYVYPMDFNIGQGIIDHFIDLPPYSKKDMHLKLLLDKFITTSIGLIIRKK